MHNPQTAAVTPAPRKGIIVLSHSTRAELPFSPYPCRARWKRADSLCTRAASNCGDLVPSPSLQAALQIPMLTYFILLFLFCVSKGWIYHLPTEGALVLAFSPQGYDSICEKSFSPLLICRNSKQLCFLIVLLSKCGSKTIWNSKQLRLGSELPEKMPVYCLFITLFTSRHNLIGSEATGVKAKECEQCDPLWQVYQSFSMFSFYYSDTR